jgi:hypothetical protein
MNAKQIEQIVCYAMRYCIGRQTYAVSDFCDFFLEHLDEWTNNTLTQAIKDIDSAPSLGDERIDMPEWLRLRAECYDLICLRLNYDMNTLATIFRWHGIKKDYTGENLIKNRMKK